MEPTHICFAWVPVCSADRSRDLRSSGMLRTVDWQWFTVPKRQ